MRMILTFSVNHYLYVSSVLFYFFEIIEFDKGMQKFLFKELLYKNFKKYKKFHFIF